MKNDTKIVGIGGGTGLSALLRGLKKLTKEITAIVTVTDDGGSSGRLRKDFNIPPPGDLRNCIAALAESDQLISKLFKYRFKGKSDLSGHSLGNLLIAALSDINGSFAKGILEISHVLAVKGKVLPSTLENVVLGARFSDGAEVLGQTKIVSCLRPIEKLFLVPQNPPAYTGVITACKKADIIILGPGSLYTSIIPNLLIGGIAQAVKESPARKVYISNIMTQPGETDNFTAMDHILTVEKYLGSKIDYAVINSGKIPENLIKKHSMENSFIVADDSIKAEDRIRIVRADLVTERGFIRHDPLKVSKLLAEIF